MHEQLDWTDRALISWVLRLKSHTAEIEELLGLIFFWNLGLWWGRARFRDHLVLDRVQLPADTGPRPFFRARYQVGVTFIPPRLPSVLCHVTPISKGSSQNDFLVFFLCPQNAFLSDFSFNSSQLQESYLMGCDHRSDTLRPFPLYHNTHTHLLSCVQLFADPWAAALQAPLSLEFSRQEYWSGLPFPPPGVRPDPSQGLN